MRLLSKKFFSVNTFGSVIVVCVGFYCRPLISHPVAGLNFGVLPNVAPGCSIPVSYLGGGRGFQRSNLGPETGYRDRRFSWLLSTSPGTFQYSTLN